MKSKTALAIVFALSTANLFIGCSTTNPWKQVAPYPDYNGLSRYENKEALCYIYVTGSDTNSLQCHFKKTKLVE